MAETGHWLRNPPRAVRVPTLGCRVKFTAKFSSTSAPHCSSTTLRARELSGTRKSRAGVVRNTTLGEHCPKRNICPCGVEFDTARPASALDRDQGWARVLRHHGDRRRNDGGERGMVAQTCSFCSYCSSIAPTHRRRTSIKPPRKLINPRQSSQRFAPAAVEHPA